MRSVLFFFVLLYGILAVPSLYTNIESGQVTQTSTYVAILQGVLAGTPVNWCIETASSSDCHYGIVCLSSSTVDANGYSMCEFDWTAVPFNTDARLRVFSAAFGSLYSPVATVVFDNNQCSSLLGLAILGVTVDSGLVTADISVGITNSNPVSLLTVNTRVAYNITDLETGLVTVGTTPCLLNLLNIGLLCTLPTFSGPNKLVELYVQTAPLLFPVWTTCDSDLAYYVFLTATESCVQANRPLLTCVDDSILSSQSMTCSVSNRELDDAYSIVQTSSNGNLVGIPINTVVCDTSVPNDCSWQFNLDPPLNNGQAITLDLIAYTPVDACTSTNTITVQIVTCPQPQDVSIDCNLPVYVGSLTHCTLNGWMENVGYEVVDSVNGQVLAYGIANAFTTQLEPFLVTRPSLTVNVLNSNFSCGTYGPISIPSITPTFCNSLTATTSAWSASNSFIESELQVGMIPPPFESVFQLHVLYNGYTYPICERVFTSFAIRCNLTAMGSGDYTFTWSSIGCTETWSTTVNYPAANNVCNAYQFLPQHATLYVGQPHDIIWASNVAGNVGPVFWATRGLVPEFPLCSGASTPHLAGFFFACTFTPTIPPFEEGYNYSITVFQPSCNANTTATITVVKPTITSPCGTFNFVYPTPGSVYYALQPIFISTTVSAPTTLYATVNIVDGSTGIPGTTVQSICTVTPANGSCVWTPSSTVLGPVRLTLAGNCAAVNVTTTLNIVAPTAGPACNTITSMVDNTLLVNQVLTFSWSSIAPPGTSSTVWNLRNATYSLGLCIYPTGVTSGTCTYNLATVNLSPGVYVIVGDSSAESGCQDTTADIFVTLSPIPVVDCNMELSSLQIIWPPSTCDASGPFVVGNQVSIEWTSTEPSHVFDVYLVTDSVAPIQVCNNAPGLSCQFVIPNTTLTTYSIQLVDATTGSVSSTCTLTTFENVLPIVSHPNMIAYSPIIHNVPSSTITSRNIDGVMPMVAYGIAPGVQVDFCYETLAAVMPTCSLGSVCSAVTDTHGFATCSDTLSLPFGTQFRISAQQVYTDQWVIYPRVYYTNASLSALMPGYTSTSSMPSGWYYTTPTPGSSIVDFINVRPPGLPGYGIMLDYGNFSLFTGAYTSPHSFSFPCLGNDCSITYGVSSETTLSVARYTLETASSLALVTFNYDYFVFMPDSYNYNPCSFSRNPIQISVVVGAYFIFSATQIHQTLGYGNFELQVNGSTVRTMPAVYVPIGSGTIFELYTTQPVTDAYLFTTLGSTSMLVRRYYQDNTTCACTRSFSIQVTPATRSCSLSFATLPATIEPGFPTTLIFSNLQNYAFARQATISINGTIACIETVPAGQTSVSCEYTWPAGSASVGNYSVSLVMNDSFCVETTQIVSVVEPVCVTAIDFSPSPLLLDVPSQVTVHFATLGSTENREYTLSTDTYVILCNMTLLLGATTASCTFIPSTPPLMGGNATLVVDRVL